LYIVRTKDDKTGMEIFSHHFKNQDIRAIAYVRDKRVLLQFNGSSELFEYDFISS